MTTQISSTSSSEQNVTQNAFSGPLASRALFWRPRFVTGASYAYHLPFSFWLTDIARPTRVMAVGIEDGESYFGICQALDKLNVAAMCNGFGTWDRANGDEDYSPSEVPANILSHNKEHYSDFSTIRFRSATAALKPVEVETLDLLIVNLATDLGDSDLFFDLATRKMSERGIILIHDLHASHSDSEKATGLEALRAAHKSIRFGDDDDGVMVVLTGSQQDDRLLHFAAMKTGAAEFNTVQSVFHQLGAGHYYAWRSAADARAAREAQNFAEQSESERDALEKKYATLNAAYEERSKKIAAEQARLHDLQQEIKALHDQLKQKSEDMATLSETLTAEQEAFEQQARDALERQLQDQGGADKKALELQLKTRFQELAILQREILAVEKRANAQIKAIKNSTSWRLTAPLRKVILMFRRKKK